MNCIPVVEIIIELINCLIRISKDTAKDFHRKASNLFSKDGSQDEANAS